MSQTPRLHRSRREAHRATPRRVVALWCLVAVAGVASLVGLASWLRLDHPPAGPLTPEIAGAPDSLRDDVVCELAAGREGEERPEAAAEPTLPEPVTSNELYDCPGTWDGRHVVYRGEVVGEVLSRGATAWLQLNDDVYAGTLGPLPTHRDFRGGNAGVGALVGAQEAAAITSVGGPTQRGDVVEVVALFRRVHAESGEVAILEVETLRVIEPGVTFPLPAAGARAAVALLATAIMLAIVVTERRMRGR